MPNTPAAIGKGVTALYARSDAPDSMVALARQLLSAIGGVVMIDDEALMDAVTAVSGSGPAYVFPAGRDDDKRRYRSRLA